MLRYSIIAVLFLSLTWMKAQNDQDAIRYSQIGFGGTSRSKAMGGSFGALGADGACMSINPAGIGLYKKGAVNVSGGMRFNVVQANLNNNYTNDFKFSFLYDGFSLVGAWDSKQKSTDHHALGVGVNQLMNFNSNTTIQGYSRNSRMLDIMAQAKGLTPANLDPSYSGLAFENYVLDTIYGQYYSFVDPTKTVKQKDQIATSGKMNELCFNYAYGYKDKLYLGATMGIPIVSYNYISKYAESDDKDSMKIVGSTSTYPYDVYYYSGYGGFKNFTYTETYKTSGSGINFKLGAIYRVTDFLRLGASFQTPTVLKLTDTYQYQWNSSFDDGGTSSTKYPDNGGKFSYRIITPMRYTVSAAFLYKKYGAINVDLERVNYSQASLQNVNLSTNTQADFSGVNTVIRSTYSSSTNLRVGLEANLQPVAVRLGYAMYGSPYGDTFSGSMVRNYATAGFGFRNGNWTFDFSFVKSFGKDKYYMFNPKYADLSTLTNSGTTIACSIGCKF